MQLAQEFVQDLSLVAEDNKQLQLETLQVRYSASCCIQSCMPRAEAVGHMRLGCWPEASGPIGLRHEVQCSVVPLPCAGKRAGSWSLCRMLGNKSASMVLEACLGWAS